MPAKGVILICLDKVNKSSLATSAVSLDGGIVLTNGSILMDLTEPKKIKWLESIVKETNSEMKVNARIDQRLEFYVFEPINENDGVNIIDSHRKMISVGIWVCPLLELSMKSLNAATEISSSTKKNSSQLLLNKLMACFMFLKPYEDGNKHDKVDIYNIVDSLSQPVFGQKIVVEWSPFCNHSLFNSISRSIVGRVFGPDNCLFLFDAAISPGVSSAPVFLANDSGVGKNCKGALIGMILCSLDNRMISVGVSLIPVLWRLLPDAVKTKSNPWSTQSWNLEELLYKTVVRIQSGEFSSSGVVVDAASGIILTASHSIADTNIDVFHMGNIYQATLIYKTPVDFHCDLAVIKVDSKNCFAAHMTMSEKPARIGEEVCSVGFPIFSQMVNVDMDARPFISLGCIAKSTPDYIQTTCCTTFGSSGGAIVRNGQLLGLVTSVMKFESVHYLRINTAVPVTVFRKNVVDYIETGNVGSLRQLELRKETHVLPSLMSKM